MSYKTNGYLLWGKGYCLFHEQHKAETVRQQEGESDTATVQAAGGMKMHKEFDRHLGCDAA